MMSDAIYIIYFASNDALDKQEVEVSEPPQTSKGQELRPSAAAAVREFILNLSRTSSNRAC